MESSSWPESSASNLIKAVQELTRGQIVTDWLEDLLIGQPEKIESNLELSDGESVQILGVLENTLPVFSDSSSNFNDNMTSPHNWDDDMKLEDSTENVKPMIPLVKVKRGCYNRSKNPIICIKECAKKTFNLVDDGYTWRKYGQKKINNSKYQRQYYRCGRKYEQGCKATKQVQIIDDEPSKYKITYFRYHTCNNSLRSCQIISDFSNPSDSSVLISFDTNPLNEKKQVGGFFPTLTIHEPNNGSPSVSIIDEKVFSSDCYTSRDPVTHSKVPCEPMSYGPDMSISDYEIDDMHLVR